MNTSFWKISCSCGRSERPGLEHLTCIQDRLEDCKGLGAVLFCYHSCSEQGYLGNRQRLEMGSCLGRCNPHRTLQCMLSQRRSSQEFCMRDRKSRYVSCCKQSCSSFPMPSFVLCGGGQWRSGFPVIKSVIKIIRSRQMTKTCNYYQKRQRSANKIPPFQAITKLAN